MRKSNIDDTLESIGMSSNDDDQRIQPYQK